MATNETLRKPHKHKTPELDGDHDLLTCEVCAADGKLTDPTEPLYLHAKCHMDSTLNAFIMQDGDRTVLTILCHECDAVVVKFPVDSTKAFE